MEIRPSYDRLISTMGFPILVRCHLYIESGPRRVKWGFLAYGMLSNQDLGGHFLTHCGLVMPYGGRDLSWHPTINQSEGIWIFVAYFDHRELLHVINKSCIRTLTKFKLGLGNLFISAPTKFEDNPINSLSANAWKLLEESEARKWEVFS